MKLFVCSSAFQLLNAIAVVKSNNIEADIMFINRRMSGICDKKHMADLGLFRNIYEWYQYIDIVSDEGIKNRLEFVKKRILKAFFYFFAAPLYISKMPNAKNKYEEIYLAYVDYPNWCIYRHFRKTGSGLNIYEDGTYTYSMFFSTKSLDNHLKKILYMNKCQKECQCVWVHQPDQVKGIDGQIQVRKIKSLPDAGRYDLIKLFYGDYSDLAKLSMKIIMFDQNLDYEAISKGQGEVARAISEIAKDRFVVKLHPSSGKNKYGSEILQFESKIPFEMIMESENFDNSRILVSIFSTACFTPKMILGKEPYIILTYKLIALESYGFFDNKYLSMIENIKESYTNKEKIYIPESMEDMISIIENILHR